jgi:hypothetical protein
MADNLEIQLKNSSLGSDSPKVSEAEIAKEKGNESFKSERKKAILLKIIKSKLCLNF